MHLDILIFSPTNKPNKLADIKPNKQEDIMKTLITLTTIFLALVLAMDTFASDYNKRQATGESYFDVATGHRYIKNADATYREYTKKGELFRASVSPYLPLLTTNKNIREIGQSCYLLYKRNKNHKIEIVVLSPDQKHPMGWSIEDMLVSMN